MSWCYHAFFYGLVQDCSISIANALEILQSCTKPSILSAEFGTVSVVLCAMWFSDTQSTWHCDIYSDWC